MAIVFKKKYCNRIGRSWLIFGGLGVARAGPNATGGKISRQYGDKVEITKVDASKIFINNTRPKIGIKLG